MVVLTVVIELATDVITLMIVETSVIVVDDKGVAEVTVTNIESVAVFPTRSNTTIVKLF